MLLVSVNSALAEWVAYMLRMAERDQEPVGRASTSRISLRLTITVATAGLIIFAITGFLGYCDRGRKVCPASLDIAHGPVPFIDSVFVKPWLLLLWLCVLVLILEQAMLSGLRGVKPEVERAWRRRMYAVTVASVVVVGIFDLYGKEIGTAVSDLIGQLGQQGLLFRLVSNPWFYTVVNFAILVALAFGAIRRWLRFQREQADEHDETTQAHTTVVPFPDTLDALDADEQRPIAMHELVIGDVLVRSALVLALSFGIRADIIGLVVPYPPPHGPPFPQFDSCSVALPGHCATTLSFVDLILALLGLVGSVAFAAVFAQAVVRQQVQAQEEESDASDAGLAGGRASNLSQSGGHLTRLPVNNAQSQNLSLDQIGRDVALQLLKTLARPFQRVDAADQDAGNRYDPLAIVSMVVWPLLVLGGMFSAAIMARAIQRTLHHTLWDLMPIPRLNGFPSDANLYELLGIVTGCLALVAIIFAARVMTRRPVSLAKGLEFIRDNGFMTLVLFCVYAFALWLVEQLLVQLSGEGQTASLRLNTFSFGVFTIASSLLLLGFVVAVLIRRGASRRARISPPTV